MKTFLHNSKFATTVFILFCLFTLSKASAQVTTLQNWTNLYNATGSGATTAYTVPAGSNSNRVLAVAIASSQSAVGARTVSITYGGQTMTLANGNMSSTGIRQHTAIYYLDEAGLDAASGSNLIYSITGGTTRATTVWAAVFDYVDQTTPITNSRNYDSGTSSVSTFVFGTTLTINTNDQAVYILSSVRSGNTTQRTISSVPTNFTIEDQQQVDNTDGIRNAIVNRAVPTSNTNSTCSTVMSNTSLGSMTGVSFKGCVPATANAGSALTAICQGGTSAVLGGSVGSPATGGTWSSSAGGTFTPNATELNATWTPPGAYSGTATLTLTTSGGSCGTATAFKTQVVNPLPSSVTATAGAATICSGGSTSLTTAFSYPPSTATNSASPSAAIPDNDLVTGITSQITLPSTCASAIEVSAVTLNISHAYNADLDIYLVSPNGTQITLCTDKGGSGVNITATLQTGGTALPTGNTTINGTFAPQSAFSGFSGGATGIWTLRVFDDANLDTGTLNSWSITVTSATCGVMTYSWSPATGLSSSTVQNPTASPTSTTNYAVTVTPPTGCAVTSATTTIAVKNTWLGTTSTAWNVGSNWSCGVPTASSDVFISTATNYPIIASDVTINSLTMDSGTTLKVDPLFDLTVTDAIVNNGTLTIENTGNLLQTNSVVNTGSGSTIVKRNSNPLIRLDYTLWSSPVSGQNLFNFSPLTSVSPNIRFYTYDNGATPNPVYSAVSAYATTDFATGIGYLIRLPFNHPTAPVIWNGQFTGTPNNGTKNVAITDTGDRFNLVGNPYPSPISISSLVNTYNSGNIESTLYFWRKTNNSASPSYCSWNAATSTFGDNGEAYTDSPLGVIQTGQGFFVQAKTGATNLVFRNEERIGNNANQFFRTSQNTSDIEAHRIWLNMTGATSGFSQAVVGYFTNATVDVDDTDSKYFNDGPIAFTSIIANQNYVIQGRPVPFDANDVVPMKYKVTASGNYNIAIDHVDGLFSGGSQVVYLRDNLTSTIHDLNSGAYNFTSDAGTFDSRFEILYQMPLHVDNPTFNDNQVVIYKNEVNDFVINSGNVVMASVKVFDIRGRLLLDKKGINASQATMNVGLANEVLLVQITSVDGEMVTKKVVR